MFSLPVIQLSHLYMTIGKIMALTIWTFIGKVMSLIFNMLSRFVRASLVAQLVKNPPAVQETRFNSWVGKIPWRRDRLPTPMFLGFPGSSDGNESAHNAGDLGSIPGLGRSPRERKGYPLQYSGLENSINCILHGVTKSRTRLSGFHFHFQPGYSC